MRTQSSNSILIPRLRLFLAAGLGVAFGVISSGQAASPVTYFTSRSTEIRFFVNNHNRRFNNTTRISGDGKKLVLVRRHSFEGMALVTWVSSFTNALTEADQAQVFLYDLASGDLKTILTGSQKLQAAKNGGWVISQRDANLSADINYDGSRVAVVYADQRMGVSSEGVATNLLADRVVRLIDTQTGQTMFEKRLATGGVDQPADAVKLNKDGSRAVFRHRLRGAPGNTWGVDYFDKGPVHLYSLVLSGNAEPTQLSEGDGTKPPKLASESLSRVFYSFDLDNAGDRVSFVYTARSK